MATPQAFISYSHSDQQWAREFAKTMIESGVNVWFDELNVQAGQPLSEALEKGLRHSDVVVLLITSENVDRPNLLFEIGAALGMRKQVIPVVPEDFQTSRLPLPLRRVSKAPGAELPTGNREKSSDGNTRLIGRGCLRLPFETACQIPSNPRVRSGSAPNGRNITDDHTSERES